MPGVDDDDTWTDDSLCVLAELPAGSTDLEEAGQASVRSLVNRVWLENDASVAIEGVPQFLGAREEGAFESPRFRNRGNSDALWAMPSGCRPRGSWPGR